MVSRNPSWLTVSAPRVIPFYFFLLIILLFNVKHTKNAKEGTNTKKHIWNRKGQALHRSLERVPCFTIHVKNPSAIGKLIIQEADGFRVRDMHWLGHLISRQRVRGFTIPYWDIVKELHPVHHWEFWSPFWSLSNWLKGSGFTLGARPVQIRHYTV